MFSLPWNTSLHLGSSVCVVGKIIKSHGNKQPIELACDQIQVIGNCDNEEIGVSFKGKQEPEQLRKYLHLRARLKFFSSILRLRSELINGIHIFMKQNDFINITTPIITSIDCEGAGHVFTLKVIIHG